MRLAAGTDEGRSAGGGWHIDLNHCLTRRQQVFCEASFPVRSCSLVEERMNECVEREPIPLSGINVRLTAFDVNATNEQTVVPCNCGREIDSRTKPSTLSTGLENPAQFSNDLVLCPSNGHFQFGAGIGTPESARSHPSIRTSFGQ